MSLTSEDGGLCCSTAGGACRSTFTVVANGGDVAPTRAIVAAHSWTASPRAVAAPSPRRRVVPFLAVRLTILT